MLYEPPRYDTRTIWISVDSYDRQVPAGRFFYPARGESSTFAGLTQLLLQMNACMDVENTPQAFHSVRTFFPLTAFEAETSGESTLRYGKESTFTEQVLYRRNSSWQGKLTWLEAGRTELFSSVLEFIHLLNSAMTDGSMTLRCAADSHQALSKAE